MRDFAVVERGTRYADNGQVHTHVVPEHPRHPAGFPGDERRDGLPRAVDGVVVRDGHAVGADKEAAGVGERVLLVEAVFGVVEHQAEHGGHIAVGDLARGEFRILEAQRVDRRRRADFPRD